MFWLAEVFNGGVSQDEMRRYELWARQQRALMVQRTFAAAAAGVVRAARLGAAGAGRLFQALQLWHRKRTAIRELELLPDHILQDIGVHRSEIRSLVEGALRAERRVRTTPAATPVTPPAARAAGEEREDDHQWPRAA